jgi:hypothetical protein
MRSIFLGAFIAGVSTMGLLGCDDQGTATNADNGGASVKNSEQAVSSVKASEGTKATIGASTWNTKHNGSLFTTDATSETGAANASFSMRFSKGTKGFELATPGGGKVIIGVDSAAGNKLTRRVVNPLSEQDTTTLKLYSSDASHMEVPYGCLGSIAAAMAACAYAGFELGVNPWADMACIAALIAEYEDCGGGFDDGSGSSGGGGN